ncbi:hypothetical protein ACOME3_009319 [Neoechinorhynchus agilis]
MGKQIDMIPKLFVELMTGSRTSGVYLKTMCIYATDQNTGFLFPVNRWLCNWKGDNRTNALLYLGHSGGLAHANSFVPFSLAEPKTSLTRALVVVITKERKIPLKKCAGSSTSLLSN